MIIKVKKNNAFFKNIFLSFITAFSLFIVIGLSNNVSANTNSHVPSSGGGRIPHGNTAVMDSHVMPLIVK